MTSSEADAGGARASYDAPVLSVQNATHQFGSLVAVDNVSITAGRGEFLTLLGESGSGKTTLLRVIAGLERPTAGRVRVARTELGPLSEDDLASFRRDHVGIVFQSFHLIPTMSAQENVAIPLELAGRADAFAAAAQGLEEVGLGDRLGHYPAQLSGGEQQRVALARAVAAEPRLLLADEPTGNLDGETGWLVIDLMFGLQTRLGMTLLLITHDGEIARRCHRIARISDGRMLDGGG